MSIGSRLEVVSSIILGCHTAEHASVAGHSLSPRSEVEARTPSKASTVDQGSFYELLRWLDPDPEIAGGKYELIRHKLMTMFRYRGCAFAEDLADETFDRVARKLPQIKTSYVGDKTSYFHGVAKKVCMEYLRSASRKRLSAVPPVKDDEEELLQRLDFALSQLDQEDRELILDYYRGDGRNKINHRKILAMRAGLHLGSLRTRTSRIRSQLREYLTTENLSSRDLSFPDHGVAGERTCKGSSTESSTDAPCQLCRPSNSGPYPNAEPIETRNPAHQKFDNEVAVDYTRQLRFPESIHSEWKAQAVD